MDYKEMLVETTPELQPHTYFLGADGRLVAFQKAGETEIKVFSKPMQFSKSRRTFKKLTAK